MKKVKPVRATADYEVILPRTFGNRHIVEETPLEDGKVFRRYRRERIKVSPHAAARVKEIARRCHVQPGTRIVVTYAGKGWYTIVGQCHNSWDNKVTYIQLKRWDYGVLAHELRHTAQAQAYESYGAFSQDYRAYSGTRVTDRYLRNPFEVDAREHERIGEELADWCPPDATLEILEAKPKQAHRMRWFWDPSFNGDEDLVAKPGGAGHLDVFGMEIRHQAECACGWKSGIADNATVSHWVKMHKAGEEV